VNPKILIVEDDQMMRSLLQTLLQIEGFEVVIAQEDQYAHIASMVERERPQLVMMDVNLRSSSGLDMLHEVRSRAALDDVRVLMSSGMDLCTECIAQGADAFILKPFMPDDLIALIRQTLRLDI
jgi:DNA-binding response OmpR family regulator